LAVECARLTTHLLTAVGLQQMVMQAGAAILTVREETQRLKTLPPQVVFLKLPGALIERLDRYVEWMTSESGAKTYTRAAAIQIILDQGLKQAEARENNP
jgi:hypothetical protein